MDIIILCDRTVNNVEDFFHKAFYTYGSTNRIMQICELVRQRESELVTVILRQTEPNMNTPCSAITAGQVQYTVK